MVQLLIEGFGGDFRRKPKEANVEDHASAIQCFHVNARFSDALTDVGSFQIQKLFRLVKYCLEAIWCRFRYGADILYYIPAPPKRGAFYRDCLVLLLCRPFFKRLVLHWEASGLGEWLQQSARTWERTIGRRLLGFADLSITLAEALSSDALYFRSKQLCVVPNGIPDPCPDFNESIQPRREARLARRREVAQGDRNETANLERYDVVFLAHCTREKGLFDALNAVALANEQLTKAGNSLRIHLTVAGEFFTKSERREFESWQHLHAEEVSYVGFITGSIKAELLEESDCLCVPTYYSAEAQPVSIIEAMAFGLPVVATAWRGIPELLPRDYPFLIRIRDCAGLAQKLIESMSSDVGNLLREHYRESLTDKLYSARLAKALENVSPVTCRPALQS